MLVILYLRGDLVRLWAYIINTVGYVGDREIQHVMIALCMAGFLDRMPLKG
jgi:hypothetical protein